MSVEFKTFLENFIGKEGARTAQQEENYAFLKKTLCDKLNDWEANFLVKENDKIIDNIIQLMPEYFKILTNTEELSQGEEANDKIRTFLFEGCRSMARVLKSELQQNYDVPDVKTPPMEKDPVKKMALTKEYNELNAPIKQKRTKILSEAMKDTDFVAKVTQSNLDILNNKALNSHMDGALTNNKNEVIEKFQANKQLKAYDETLQFSITNSLPFLLSKEPNVVENYKNTYNPENFYKIHSKLLACANLSYLAEPTDVKDSTANKNVSHTSKALAKYVIELMKNNNGDNEKIEQLIEHASKTGSILQIELEEIIEQGSVQENVIYDQVAELLNKPLPEMTLEKQIYRTLTDGIDTSKYPDIKKHLRELSKKISADGKKRSEHDNQILDNAKGINAALKDPLNNSIKQIVDLKNTKSLQQKTKDNINGEMSATMNEITNVVLDRTITDPKPFFERICDKFNAFVHNMKFAHKAQDAFNTRCEKLQKIGTNKPENISTLTELLIKARVEVRDSTMPDAEKTTRLLKIDAQFEATKNALEKKDSKRRSSGPSA